MAAPIPPQGLCRRALEYQNPARDAGMSLIELLVAMVVSALLLGAVSTVFVGTLRGTRTVNTKTSTGADVRLATEAMTRTLKVATKPYGEAAAFVSASSTGMSFYALLNRTGSQSASEPIPTLVTYSYASNCLTEYQTPGSAVASPPAGGPYYSWPVSARRSKCLLRSTTSPAFTFFDSGDLSAAAMTPATGLSAGDLSLVRSVQITLTATDPNNANVAGVPAETRVSLENLINADGS